MSHKIGQYLHGRALFKFHYKGVLHSCCDKYCLKYLNSLGHGILC